MFTQNKKSYEIIKIIGILAAFLLFGLVALGYARIAPGIFAIREIYSINPANRTSDIEPKAKLSFKFNWPISKDAEAALSITPEVKGKFFWEDEFGKNYGQTLVFIPDQYFAPDTLYKINIKEIRSFYGSKKENLNYFFRTVKSPKVLSVIPTQEKGAINIKPKFEIAVQEISPFFYLKFDLDPSVKLKTEYKKRAKNFIVEPQEALKQGTEYKLRITKQFFGNRNQKNKISETTTEHKYKTLAPIRVEESNPQNDTKEYSNYGEIKVRFNRAVDYKSAEEHFEISPKVPGKLGWEKNALIFQPDEFSSLTWYEVKLKKGIKGHSDNGYSEEDFSVKFQTRYNFAAAVQPAEKIEPTIKKGKYIDIDISQQILTMFENGASKGSYLISSGTYDMPTPFGEFKVLNKQDVAYSTEYDLYMPFWMQFTTVGHGVHELPFWKYKGGYDYHERESHLGTRVSHGCVRLGVGPAEKVYKWAEIGTPLVVHE